MAGAFVRAGWRYSQFCFVEIMSVTCSIWLWMAGGCVRNDSTSCRFALSAKPLPTLLPESLRILQTAFQSCEPQPSQPQRDVSSAALPAPNGVSARLGARGSGGFIARQGATRSLLSRSTCLNTIGKACKDDSSAEAFVKVPISARRSLLARKRRRD